MSHPTKTEGHPIPGAEAMGFSEATDKAEPVTGHLDGSVNRPSQDQLNETVSPKAQDAARSRPLFAPDDAPITGRLDEAVEEQVSVEEGKGRR